MYHVTYKELLKYVRQHVDDKEVAKYISQRHVAELMKGDFASYK